MKSCYNKPQTQLAQKESHISPRNPERKCSRDKSSSSFGGFFMTEASLPLVSQHEPRFAFTKPANMCRRRRVASIVALHCSRFTLFVSLNFISSLSFHECLSYLIVLHCKGFPPVCVNACNQVERDDDCPSPLWPSTR